MSSFIPTGKTSLVKRGDTALQVQTEYAGRPYPRITTTILNNGQVLHKIERKLEHALGSPEQQRRAELLIQKQHAEVSSCIMAAAPSQPPQPQPIDREGSAEGTSSTPDLSLKPIRRQPLHDRYADIPGFQSVYQLDNAGNFRSDAACDQFRRNFREIHQCLQEILNVFPITEDNPRRRERGVYEVTRDRLYLISTGDEILFIAVTPPEGTMNLEDVVRRTVLPSEIDRLL